MRIHNQITLHAPPDELFAFLSDVERVAPCLPGATVEGKEGEDYAGRMKVKVGPINATYRGKMRFVELDKEARRAVMRARAEEVNGQGNAEAMITTEVKRSGEDSIVRMDTDLQMRGKVAQFGRGAMEKISQRMFEEFARNIEQTITANGETATTGEVDGSEPTAAQPQPAAPPEGGREPARPPSRAGAGAGEDGAALDVFGVLGGPLLAKAGAVLGVALLALGYCYVLGRLRESRATVERMARLL